MMRELRLLGEIIVITRKRALTLVELPAVSRRKCAAFTLVELLVVVAILAIIISMLLPALRSAREAGKSAACKSNQHQIGLGIAVYRQVYRGMYPPYRYPDPWTTSTSTVKHQLYGIRNFVDGPPTDWDGDPDTGINVPDPTFGFLGPYIQASRKLLTCPAYREFGPWPWPWDPPYTKALNSYALNLWMGGWDDPGPSRITLPNESHLDRGAEIINYADSIGIRLYIWWPSAAQGFGYPGPGQYREVNEDPFNMWLAPYNRHMGMCNFLMGDGHVVDQDAAIYWDDYYWKNP